MIEIKIFNSPQFGEVRTVKKDFGNPLFHATDIAKSLGYENPAEAISIHCKSANIEKCYIPHTNGLGGVNMHFIPEAEVYRLVMRSKLPDAEKFQDWVCEEVLPAIRKNGGYITTTSEDTPETILARAVLVANDSIERLKKENAEKTHQLSMAQKQLEHQAPVINYANEVLSSTTGHTATVIGAELNMSAITLNKLLCKAHLIRKTGKKGEYSLCALHQGMGYVVTDTRKYYREDDSIGSRIEIHFTEAGRMKIHEITKRAIVAGVLKEVKGRYFINNSWVPAEKQS
jgi:anti-repressor protein